MTEEEVAQVLDLALQRPVAYHKAFAKIAGKACAAVMLAQAWYWMPRSTKLEGWFYKSRKEWTEETGLTRTEQETARRRLVKLGILQEELRGMPATMHFRIDKTRVISLLAENLPTERRKTCKQVGGKPANQSAEKPPTITESTTESNQENKEPSPHARLMDHLQIRYGPIANGGKEGKAVKWLLEHYSVDECIRCFDYLTNEWTAQVSWTHVASHIGAFIGRQFNGNGNGHKPTASEKRVDQLRSNFEFLRSGGRSVDS